MTDDDLLAQAAALQTPEEIKALEEVAPLNPGDFQRAGTKMSERDTMERVIEGGRLASDGCRHLSSYFLGGDWDRLAGIFDELRKVCAVVGGHNIPGEAVESQRKLSGDRLTRNDAYDRVYRGLSMMAAGCYQMAGGHRGDIRWSKIAYMVLHLRDQAGNLIRMKQQTILRVN